MLVLIEVRNGCSIFITECSTIKYGVLFFSFFFFFKGELPLDELLKSYNLQEQSLTDTCETRESSDHEKFKEG